MTFSVTRDPGLLATVTGQSQLKRCQLFVHSFLSCWGFQFMLKKLRDFIGGSVQGPGYVLPLKVHPGHHAATCGPSRAALGSAWILTVLEFKQRSATCKADALNPAHFTSLTVEYGSPMLSFTIRPIPKAALVLGL